MSTAASDDRGDYNLVMPFVACATEGGPFDDAAYVAGFEAGRFAADPRTGWYHSENLPQLDLLAMRSGLALRHETHPGSPWTWVEVEQP